MTEEDNKQLLAQLLKQRKEVELVPNEEAAATTEAMLQRKAKECGVDRPTDPKVTRHQK
ncbi:hypothetical protein [Shimia sp.]|uniref:hypothetical protein n=1 Tax=Shimia sp. TaxID=1954381 RepID=UPI003B8CA2E9